MSNFHKNGNLKTQYQQNYYSSVVKSHICKNLSRSLARNAQNGSFRPFWLYKKEVNTGPFVTSLDKIEVSQISNPERVAESQPSGLKRS